MPERRPPEITESIAEALRAGLALIAVVLLARANVGALTRSPSVWVGLPIGLLVWGAAACAARWSPWTAGSRLRVWRDCVAPALITLVIAGRGGAGSLSMALGLIVIGSLAVGFAAGCCCRATGVCERPAVELETVPTIETIVEGANTVDSPRSGPGPMLDREGEAPAQPQRGDGIVSDSQLSGSFALPAEAETPPQDAAPADLAEIVDSAVNEPSPVESWTRTESDGEVSIEAVIQARFAEGSKLAVVHLPFVPPLPSVPQIECEPLDSGCEVEIKTEAAYRHGASLSVTRPIAGPTESVPIGIMVYTSAEEPIES